MKHIAPTYYPAFRCIAERCRHNCCIGWEIDIDSDTAAWYATLDGDLGKRLSQAITQTDGVSSFVLTPDERCPFLNTCGRCDIIETLGDGALCQICADHPRFHHHLSDRVETGLGLSCEEAARIILTHDHGDWVTIGDDDKPTDSLWDDEVAMLAQRAALFAVARDRSRSVREREAAVLHAVGCPSLDGAALAQRWMPLERLEASWGDTLATLTTAPDLEPPADLQAAFERLLVYFLFRHLPDALDDGMLAQRAAFAAHSTKLLRLLCTAGGNTLDVLLDLARRYSAEVEYSDENVTALLRSF